MKTPQILAGRFAVQKDTFRKGGTATVFKSVDITNGQAVAIKLFGKSNLSFELTKEAYSRDIKSLVNLNSHSNIAKFIDFGVDPVSSSPFIALEWLENNILQVLEERPISGWDEFYSHYGRPILEALSFSHGRDIVHRDIKPQNVLFTDKNELRIVDFGISKYKRLWGSSITFSDWKSPPYSPPESDSIQYLNSRDVYGFAALSIACLAGRELLDSEDLFEVMKSLAIEDGIVEVLTECLSNQPDERPQSIDGLIDVLDRFETSNPSLLGGYENCYLELSKRAIQQLQIFLGVMDKTSIERRVSSDLNEVCGIDRMSGDVEHFSFIAASYRYRVVVDDLEHRYFKVIGVFKSESWRQENDRQRAYAPKVIYKVGVPPASEEVMKSTINFLEGLSEYESGKVERDQEYVERRLIEKWRSQLRLQFDLEKLAKNEVLYHSFEVVDGLVELYVGSGEWQDLIGQERILHSRKNENQTVVSIESVRQKTILLSAQNLDEERIPSKGGLSLDVGLQAISRIRQEYALDDVVFNRAVRGDLKRLIFQPSLARVPVPKDCDVFFQDNLDKRKREIVSAVLGLDDFLVVKGPPGTGKTKLIVEIVLQYLRENPKRKVLISSQTHNALDNALEKIREIMPEGQHYSVVRVARRDDHRVSEKVRDLMLDNLVESWLKTVKDNSTQYLERWSKSIGVNREEVELGLAVRNLRNRVLEYDIEVEKRESLKKQKIMIDEIIDNAKKSKVVPEELPKYEFNREIISVNLREKEGEVVRSRRLFREAQHNLSRNFGKDGELLSSLEVYELEEWENEYLAGTAERVKCREVIELLQDWYDRFGRSDDFYAAYLDDASIVAATCIGIGPKSYRDIEFDLCIIDEASKATPTETLLPVVKSKKWVFVGDSAQLPPFVQQGSRDSKLLVKHDLSVNDLKSTMLDMLVDKLPSEAVKSLEVQYRMCPEIGGLISSVFYNKTLSTGRGSAIRFQDYLAIPSPVVWYCTSSQSGNSETKDENSYVNRCESDYIASVLSRFNFAAKTIGKKFTVCVLSFYSSQKSVLSADVARVEKGCDMLTIICDTVDSFQGREADICIVSITRSNKDGELGFVNDFNRVNVALSRGKESLVIVGNSERAVRGGTNNPLIKVIEYIAGSKQDCSLVRI